MAHDLASDDRLHHLIWETYTRMLAIADSELDDPELTLPLAGTLDLIAANPGATVTELSRRTPKTQQALSQTVSKLQRHGYVERRVGSGRGVGLYLTETGRAAHARGTAMEKRIDARLRELLGDAGFERLRQELLEIRRLFASTVSNGA